ncbi:ficolin-2-like [Procambarus clarkii]|uniref:ficolin-2-like n=1 Tax=Procambarus clarkii TaxID=6728 RepID=UPI001E673747|nr:ficolin-2-like [Procambarus clarkii]XP_045590942.1 ficolin-2-like [Procambarus clarkii]XP_045590943.1 ficolin-2-like [Procambarus clarkii]XP_045590944.1 ficolin-2-like [Procambarus clarkii]
MMGKPQWMLVLVGTWSMFVVVAAEDTIVNSYLTEPLWLGVGFQNRNCRELQDHGHKTSGVYTIYPYDCCPKRPVRVYCDMDSNGGGWTVIQRREDILPRKEFYRTWMEYALGFGNLSGEFWLGLDHIHALTEQTLNQIYFDLADFDNAIRWAQYQFFYVHDRSASYKVGVNGYTGDAGDGFSFVNGQRFTTKDKDLDTFGGNCAVSHLGAWWYTSCHSSNLNGKYHKGNHTSYADGVNWYPFRGHHYSLKRTEMKIRPAY